MNDEAILALYFARDEQAVAETDRKYGPYCFTIANAIVKSEPDAEETVSDTWLRAWETIPPRRPQVLKMYLAKITRNLAFSRWRAFTAEKRGGGELPLALEELGECVPAQGSPEEAIAAYIAEHDQERYDELAKTETPEQLQQFGYGVIWAKRLEELYACPETIVIDTNRESTLRNHTLAQGAAVVTPMAFQIDEESLDFLHTSIHGDHRIDADNIRSLTIRYQDGTEYQVLDENLDNTAFTLISYPGDNVQTEVFVPAEEDPQGEGYVTVENSKNQSIMTLMFNRLIDIDKIQSVIINGTELHLD